ncbi:hypothetical protein K491DRAFT_762723 [Lophiostoma macrostomum CBS 122681]|uniref:Uncharacterized protein n=1 Tax=Lophiostoma macrostomum CBS 122681 TaxID=1314788 RepID=A0A6A6SMV6_9PLEO|nr:hypothetical protein K491DRAFT_762723 [Lophiostoma macrostomum CBS 122681]
MTRHLPRHLHIRQQMGNLEPATFKTDDYAAFPDASCGTGARFWTCKANTPPFWGCCKSDPCNGQGCPRDDLVGAFIDRPEQKVAYLGDATLTLGSVSTLMLSTLPPATPTSSLMSTSIMTTQPSATETSGASQSTGEQASGSSSPPGKQSNTALVAGTATGGVLGICLILGLVYFFLSRRRRGKSGNIVPDSEHIAKKDKLLSNSTCPELEACSSPGQLRSPPPPYSTPTPVQTEVAELESAPLRS